MREAASSTTLLEAHNQVQSIPPPVCLSEGTAAALQARQSPPQLFAHPQPDAPLTVI
jgi:hypothetical protein